MTDGEESVRARLGSLVSGIRFGKFVSVGVVGSVCDTIVLLALTSVGVVEEVAWLAGVETAILVMFLVNENWTFADHSEGGRESFVSRLKRSHVVRAGGVTTQFVVFLTIYRLLNVDVVFGDVALLVELAGRVGLASALESLDLWLLVAKGSGVAVGMVVNYVFESLFTWQVHEA